MPNSPTNPDEKKELLEKLTAEYEEKISEENKAKVLGGITSIMLSRLTRQLIKTSGYGVALTILRREMENVGRENALEIMKTFNLSGDKQSVASKILKIAAMLLGLNLKVVGDETVVTDCSMCKLATEEKEPALAKICFEYCCGVVGAVLGDGFRIVEDKCIGRGDEYCSYSIRQLK